MDAFKNKQTKIVLNKTEQQLQYINSGFQVI